MGPVSERVTIHRTIDVNRSSVANCVLRKLAINRKPLWNGAQDVGPKLCSVLLTSWFSILSVSIQVVYHEQEKRVRDLEEAAEKLQDDVRDKTKALKVHT